MNIAIVGAGYVGLVTGACFAELGNKVICVDNDASKIKSLRALKIPIYEPGLDELVKRNYSHERIAFTTDISHAVKNSTMNRYKGTKAHFVDCLIAATAVAKKVPVSTFDQPCCR